jgi:ABC-type transport system involved in multi-copper enzyme maturation permease subunit
MVWIALGLLVLMTTIVGLITLGDRWGMRYWRSGRTGRFNYQTYQEALLALPLPVPATAFQHVFTGVNQALLANSGFYVFTTWWVFFIFLSFLLPIWTLSFATDALGGERESRTLPWLLIQPLPRPHIYLAKFVAVLPFCLGLNLGGFALICWAAGQAGRPAFALFWPALAWGTLAFCALFHLMGALFRRATVVALVYSFFLETILGNMPGNMKRVSIGFYVRCMMFEEAQGYNVQPEKPSIYLPVDGSTAQAMLIGLTVVLLAAGMVVFARSEYQDLT